MNNLQTGYGNCPLPAPVYRLKDNNQIYQVELELSKNEEKLAELKTIASNSQKSAIVEEEIDGLQTDDFVANKVLYDGVNGYDTHFSTVLIPKKNDEYELQTLGEYITKDKKIIDFFKSYNMRPSMKNFTRLINISSEFKKMIYSEYADKIYQLMAASIKIPSEISKRLNDSETAVKYNKYILYKTSKGSIRQFSPLSYTLGYSDDLKPEYGRRRIRGDWWGGFYKDMMNVAKEGGRIEFKNGKKPVRLIKQLIKLATKQDSTVLDFFAGSSTTADAVMQLNAEDGGHRKFIMATLPEPTYSINKDGKEVATKGGKAAFNAGYRTIDEISRERIVRSAKKIREENPELPEDFDDGFKHYRVVSPTAASLDDLEYSDNVQQNLLDNMVDQFSAASLTEAHKNTVPKEDFPWHGYDLGKDASGKDTILQTWLVSDGYKFDVTTDELDFAGYKVPYVDGTRLYLIDKGWSAKNTKELVNEIGNNKLTVQTIVVYGYNFDLESLNELQIALQQLDVKVNLNERF